MHIDNQHELKEALKSGTRLFWIHEGTAMELTSIGERADEPDLCAQLIPAQRGYIALYNVEPGDIFVCKPFFPTDDTAPYKVIPRGDRCVVKLQNGWMAWERGCYYASERESYASSFKTEEQADKAASEYLNGEKE